MASPQPPPKEGEWLYLDLAKVMSNGKLLPQLVRGCAQCRQLKIDNIRHSLVRTLRHCEPEG